MVLLSSIQEEENANVLRETAAAFNEESVSLEVITRHFSFFPSCCCIIRIFHNKSILISQEFPTAFLTLNFHQFLYRYSDIVTCEAAVNRNTRNVSPELYQEMMRLSDYVTMRQFETVYGPYVAGNLLSQVS